MHFIFQGILVCMSKTEITLDVQVKALIECKRLQPLAMPDEATGGGMSLRQVAGGALLSAEVALMWRVVCTWLQVGSAASCNPVQSIPCSNSLHKPHLETYYDSPFTVASASSHMLCSGAREACCGLRLAGSPPGHAMRSRHAGGRERQGAGSRICQRGSGASRGCRSF